MKKTLVLLIFLVISVALVSGFAITGKVIEVSPTTIAVKTTYPEQLCIDKCGDGVCQEIVCLGTGCPCAETPDSCPQDCVKKACAEEGEYTSGPVSPQYQYGCCEGLEGYNTRPGLVGGGLLCYDPSKGTPVCKYKGTRSEGWYYSRTGKLLKYDTCERDEAECPVEQITCKEGEEIVSYIGDDGCTHFKCVSKPTDTCGTTCQRKGYDYGKCRPGALPITSAAREQWCHEGEVDIGASFCVQIESTETYPISCSDGIKNNDETSVDCGGSCEPCKPTTAQVQSYHCCCGKKEPQPPQPMCTPVCKAVGSRSEGWYDSCTGKLIKYDNCVCVAVCRGIGTEREGYYSSCTGELIIQARCARPEPIEVTIRARPVEIQQKTELGIVEIRSVERAVTREKLIVEEGKLSLSTVAGVKEIKYLPEEVKQKAVETRNLIEVTRIELVEEEGSPVYEVDGKIKAKFLWIIPISKQVTVKIDAATNEVIQ